MAKKGLSYSPSESLIRGAAAIGQSKLPTSMKGLQAITMVSSQMIEKDRARTAEARENIENTIAKVLADGGTLSDQHFSFATKEAQQYKEEYMRGVAMNNSDGNVLKTKALNNLQKLSNSSNEEVELRKNLAKLKEDDLLTDNLDIATFEAYLNNDYVLRYEDGKKIYKIDNVDYTYEDIKKFEKDIKNQALTDVNFKQINNLPAYIKYNSETKTKTFNEQAFNDIMLNSISTDKRGFLNQIKDTTIGGKSMEDFITNASGDILVALEKILPEGYKVVDMNNSTEGGDDLDRALMIKDAILNPANGAFNVDNSRKTIAEVLTIEARNKAQKDGLFYVEPEKSSSNVNKERETLPVNYGIGYITTKSAKLLLQDIKNKKPKINFATKQYKFIPSINKYVELTKNPETGQTIQTPISNQDILMTAEVWEQGYRTEEFEQDVTGALDTATDKPDNKLAEDIEKENQRKKDEEQNLRNQGMTETTT